MNYIYIYYKKIDQFNTRSVFVSDKQEKRFVEKRNLLERDGFELLYDSAKTLEEAYKFSLENEAYPDYCVECNTYSETHLYRGKKYDYNECRFYPFNGYICESCSENSEDLKVKKISDYKPKLF